METKKYIVDKFSLDKHDKSHLSILAQHALHPQNMLAVYL